MEGSYNSTVPRRAVLRKAALATAMTAGGLVGATGSAMAHVCPRTQGFWKNHPEGWPVSDSTYDGSRLTELSTFLLLDENGDELVVNPIEHRDRLLEELQKPPRGDKYLILVKQYVAARVNRKHAKPNPVRTYPDFWEKIGEYHAWVRDADRPQRRWVVDGIDGEAMKDYFEGYNAGVGFGHC